MCARGTPSEIGDFACVLRVRDAREDDGDGRHVIAIIRGWFGGGYMHVGVVWGKVDFLSTTFVHTFKVDVLLVVDDRSLGLVEDLLLDGEFGHHLFVARSEFDGNCLSVGCGRRPQCE